jgi:hypothetical protein
MAVDALTGDLLDTYRTYSDLLTAVGHSVNPSAIAGYLAGRADDGACDALEAALSSDGAGIPDLEALPETASEKMEALLRTLTEEVADVLGGSGGAGSAEDLAEALRDGEEGDRLRVEDAVLLNGHRQFLRPSYLPIEDFRRALADREDGGDLALVKLVPFIRRELARRGVAVGPEQVRGWFTGKSGDEAVPSCLKQIMSGVNGEFKTGLIALDEMTGGEDPDEWLESVRQALKFRSHSSMHKAIAHATSLKYDCVHKALSGRRKAQRIQAEIKYCVEMWIEDEKEGREPDIDEDLRGVPVADMHDLLPELERKFRTKEDIYRVISERTRVKTGSVRRYFQSNGQLKYAPLAVYRCAAALTSEEEAPVRRTSYLVDSRTRRIAERLADKVNEAFSVWQCDEEDEDLQYAYRELRRVLILTIKERRRTTPVPA